MKTTATKTIRAFSLVEVLAAVTIIGIIAFLALPNIVAIKEDSETNLAISRAEALNMSMASLVQANGRDRAITLWSGAADEQARYDLLAAYLSFAPAEFTDYVPDGYAITLPSSLSSLTKVSLADAEGTAISY